jgi:hypothetical protein
MKEPWKEYWSDSWRPELDAIRKRSRAPLRHKAYVESVRFSKLLAEGWLPEEAMRLMKVRFSNRAITMLRRERRKLLSEKYNDLLAKGNKKGRDTYLKARRLVELHVRKKNLVLKDIGKAIERLYREGKIKKYARV